MSTSNPNQTSQALANAQAQLVRIAQSYSNTGKKQFRVLKTICDQLRDLKLCFKQTPRNSRPTPNWKDYAKTVANHCGLGDSVETANNYIRLGQNIDKVGIDVVAKIVTGGGYCEAVKVVNLLLGKTETKTTHKSIIAALRRLIKNVESIEQDLPPVLRGAATAAKANFLNLISAIEPNATVTPPITLSDVVPDSAVTVDATSNNATEATPATTGTPPVKAEDEVPNFVVTVDTRPTVEKATAFAHNTAEQDADYELELLLHSNVCRYEESSEGEEPPV